VIQNEARNDMVRGLDERLAKHKIHKGNYINSWVHGVLSGKYHIYCQSEA